jgi:hypothetical protein
MITGVDSNMDFIFIHIPKVAGHTIGSVIQRPSRSHLTAQKIKNQTPEDIWDASFKFCFIRNPWDLTVSWYNFHFTKYRESMYRCSFEDWIHQGLQTHWKTDWCGDGVENDPLNQALYFQDEEENDIVDFIGAFETLEDDLMHVCHQLNITPVDVPKLNDCPHEHYRTYYTSETKDIVGKRYENIITRFNYEF